MWQLTQYKDNERKTLAGNLVLLQIWFWEKVSMVHLYPALHHTGSEKPLMQYWDRFRANAHGNIRSKNHLLHGKIVEDIRKPITFSNATTDANRKKFTTATMREGTSQSQKTKKDSLKTSQQTKADESCDKEDPTHVTNEEIEKSEKNSSGTSDIAQANTIRSKRSPSKRESKPARDTEQFLYFDTKPKRRRKTKATGSQPIQQNNEPNWPHHTTSTSAEYIICDPKEHQTIQYTHDSAETKILVDYGNYKVNRKEFCCLLDPEEWLNSETVNACIRLLRTKCVNEREDGTVYLETAYNSKILWRDSDMDPKNTNKDERSFIVQRGMTYLQHDMIFLPINIDQKHWYAAVVNARKREIQILDSMSYQYGEDDPEKVLQGLEKHLDIIVDLELFQEGQKWKDTKVTKWPWKRPIKHKMQYDGSSCGLFLIKFFELWTGNKFSTFFTQGVNLYEALSC